MHLLEDFMTWLRQWLAAWLSKRERAAPDACPAFALRIPADHPPLDDTPIIRQILALKLTG